MPPLSLDPCEACFPPTVEKLRNLSFVPHEHPKARVLPATVAHRQQTVHCDFGRPASRMTFDAAKAEFEASWKQRNALANVEAAP
jgi:hypothetical protein